MRKQPGSGYPTDENRHEAEPDDGHGKPPNNTPAPAPSSTDAVGGTVPITAGALHLAAPRFIISGLEPDDFVQRRLQTTRIELHDVGSKGHAPIKITVANMPQPGPADVLNGFMGMNWVTPGSGFHASEPRRFGNLEAGQTFPAPLATVTVDKNHPKGSASIDIGLTSTSQNPNPSIGTLFQLPGQDVLIHANFV